MFTLFADTDCDVDLKLAQELNCKLISMPIVFEDQEIYPYETITEFNEHEYYEKLRSGLMPKTFGLSPEKYINYFEEELKNNKDILYVHFSSKMSGTFNAMNLAIDELKQKYPERKILTLDTKAITVLALAILIDIANFRRENDDLNKVYEYGHSILNNYSFIAFANNLTFFKRSGRLNGLETFFGSIMAIKPIITIDNEGYMKTCGKQAGTNNAINYLIEVVKNKGVDLENNELLIAESDAREKATRLVENLKKEINKDLKTRFIPINMTAGAHCGPDCIGIGFRAKNR